MPLVDPSAQRRGEPHKARQLKFSVNDYDDYHIPSAQLENTL